MRSDLVKFEGWDLDTSDADAPRVRDIDIGERAGLAQPRDVRRVIEKNRDELSAYGDLRISAPSAQFRRGPKGRQYWLNEEQATALMAMLKTPLARQLRITLVKLFVAYRRGQVLPPTTVALDIVHGPRVGDVPLLKKEISNMCAAAGRASKISVRSVHGWVRRTFKVPGIHHIGVAIWPIVKDALFQVMLGSLVITTARRLPAGDPRQLPMFGPN